MNGLSQVVDPFLLNSYPTLTSTAPDTALSSAQTIVASERQLAFETYSNKALAETVRAEPSIVFSSHITDFVDQSVFNGLSDSDNCLNSYFCDQPLTQDWNPYTEPLIPDNTLTNGSLINGNDLNNCFLNYEPNYETNAESKSNVSDICPQQIPKKSANKTTTAKKSRKEYTTSQRSEKTVSAYALFFRDAQSMIKAANPSASFGEISKIVASNWETLDNDNKNLYKQRAEQEKKKLLKKRAADRAQEIAGLMAAKLGASEAQTNLNSDDTNNKTNCFNANDQQVNDSAAYDQSQTSSGHNHVANNSSQVQQNLVSTTNQSGGDVRQQKCIRANCTNNAIESPEWDSEYCSTECCVRHCADVFEAWVQKQNQNQIHQN